MENRRTTEGESASKRLLIVDGHAYAYRAFYAIRSLSSPSGQATNAIYGFIRMLQKMRERVQPSHLIVVWDGALAEERMALHPEYKAHRPEMPDDLRRQLEPIVTYLRAANVFSLLKETCEADDCIAAMALQAARAGMEVIIASSDKDFMQLISPVIKLLNRNDKTETLFGAAEVKRKTGVEPAQIVDWLSLIGDSVDNIPGVPGVGPKTATDLLVQFGSVEEMYRRLPEVRSERLRGNLQAAEKAVRRNRDLIRLKEETECAVALEDLLIQAADDTLLRSLFLEWGFKTMARELEEARLAKEDFFKAETLSQRPSGALMDRS
jgi:DNA polymerase-1